ncbi:8036_t:CDS:2 [Paraglomus occultum]|uniref:8036_t:CDS:1 n=1 Tax=Paraglomus occultum TaxID=144539 RepID=A0A9N8VHH6_9GLOM|nr:8036_t:CDS:2 [Paraglomus occultum]
MNIPASGLDSPRNRLSSRQRRRSNSSGSIPTNRSIKAVRSPRRDVSHKDYNIPRPPRLVFDIDEPCPKMSMTPPSKHEYTLSTLYKNSERGMHHGDDSTFRDRSFYKESIEKKTSMGLTDDEDTESETLSCVSTSVSDDEKEKDPTVYDQVSKLKKEIDSVKETLAGLQQNHAAMLNEKKHLEVQYKQTRDEVVATLEDSKELLKQNDFLNSVTSRLSIDLESGSDISDDEIPIEWKSIMDNCRRQADELNDLQSQMDKSRIAFRELLNMKKDIEYTLELKEREYEEKIRQVEAVASGQSTMINSMEKLLKGLECKMDRLMSEKYRRHTMGPTVGDGNYGHARTQSSSSISGGNKNNNGNAGDKKSVKKHKPQQNSISLLKKELEKSKIDKIEKKNEKKNDRKSLDGGVPDLMPARCLSPPQSRRESYTNPMLLMTEEEIIRHQARFALTKRWVEDDEVSTCQHYQCTVKFNWWNRRHHCRRCGDIFCSTHSAYSMLLFPDGNEDWGGVWSRVCENCFKDTK